MRRILHIILITCAFNINVIGANKNVISTGSIYQTVPRWTFGAEWSYVGTFHYSTMFNYFNTDGYRENTSSDRFGYWNNGEVLLHVGYNMREDWSLSVYVGATGLGEFHRAIPFSVRVTHLFKRYPMTDTWLAFADLGTGISLKHEPQEIVTGKIGGGYRINLSPGTKLDFIAAMRLAYTHPQIMDGDDMITLKWTNRNIAFIQSFSLGMSIIF